MQGYFSRFPGCYQTSDRAIRDPDGHLWVVGRTDDVINVAAHRISTMEIESAVNAQAGVAEAAVIGVDDPVKGTVPVAFVTLMADADRPQVERAVAAAVDHAIGGIARLHKVYVTRSIPKTRAGKIMRRLLREAVQSGRITSDTTGLEDPDSLTAILDSVREG
jgi:acetyl-CoA synthetase